MSATKRTFRFVVKSIFIVILLFVLLVLFIRSPWGQNIIINQLTNYVSSKTNTTFTVERFYLSFDGNLVIDNLYVEDQARDTLLFSKYLEIDIPLMPIIRKNQIKIEDIDWQNAKTTIYRKTTTSNFNYQFLIDAFAADDTNNQNDSSAYTFEIGNIHFKDIDLSYIDEHNALKTRLSLGETIISFREFNLDSLTFQLNEIKFTDSDFLLEQSENETTSLQQKPAKAEDTQSKTLLPKLTIDKLFLDNVSFEYTDAKAKLTSDGKITQLNVIESFFDLNANVYQLDSIYLADSSFKLDLPSAENTVQEDENANFEWPLIDVKANAIEVKNNSYQITQNQAKIKSNKVDAAAIGMEEFNFKINNFIFSKNEAVKFHLEQFNFKESSGIELKEFQFYLVLNQQQLVLDNLNFATLNNRVNGSFQINYNQLKQWISNPTEIINSAIRLDAHLAFSELTKVLPSLVEIPYYKELASSPLILNVDIKGDLQQLKIKRFNAKWSASKIAASGHVFSLDSISDFNFQIDDYQITTPKKDFTKFIEKEALGNVNLPSTIEVSGSIGGSTSQIKTTSSIRIPEGKLLVYADLQQGNYIRLNTDVKLLQLNVGKLINQPDLLPVSLQFNTKIEGKDWWSLKGKFNSSIQQLQYASMDFSALQMAGEIKDKEVEVDANFNNDMLRFNSISRLTLDSLQPQLKVNFNLEGIDFNKFGLSSKNIRAKTKLNANIKGNIDDFKLNASIDSTMVVYNDDSFNVAKVSLNALANSNESEFSIQSKFLNSQFTANAHPNEIIASLKSYFDTLLQKNKIEVKDDVKNYEPVDFDFSLRFQETPFISKVVLEGLKEMDTLSLDVVFREEQQKFSTHLLFPKLVYENNQINNLSFDFVADSSSADYNLGFDSLSSGIFKIAETQLFGHWQEEQIFVNFEANDDENPLFTINAIINKNEDEFSLSILPNQLILNGKPWNIPENNLAMYKPNSETEKLQFTAFEVSRNQQYIAFKNNFDITETHTGIDFKDFKLSTFSNYINTEEELIKGALSGNFIVVNPFEKLGILSDLSISNLMYQNTPIGNVNLKATSNLDDIYQLKLDVLGDYLQLNATSEINNTNAPPIYTSNIAIDKIELPLIEQFSSAYISETKGNISGKFDLSGKLEDLSYSGNIQFSDAEFKLNSLNAIFKLGNENIKISDNAIQFNNFHLKDINNNVLDINGRIGIVNPTNPIFDLQAKASNFQILNSTSKDNNLYYGKVNFDTDFKLLGDLNFPKIIGSLRINEATDFTYIVPQEQVGTVEREGVVLFVNKKNPDDILTQKSKDQYNATISGVEINAQVSINSETKAKVVFNKKTGDNIKLIGGGKLKLDMARNGDLSLSGKYEVSRGELELNLYNLVTRRFQIANQSTVSWYGDPYNADLDIRAIYTVETSASSLMASQISSESSAVQNQFRQQLPFQVYLDVDGEILAPELIFELDMPESERAAVNGSVYNRVLQINQEEDELNKQVFSLLVLNRFYPTAGSDGSQGGAASLARSNINQALSDQLNTYANKLTANTGIELNFDLNSYTDFQSGSANNRTDVDITAQKKLLDERLIVEAGSQVNVEGDLRPGEQNVALGNISVQYILTPDGRWKIKAFRRSEYENVIDGQVFISGIALIFTREFNRFKDLWAKSFMKKSE